MTGVQTCALPISEKLIEKAVIIYNMRKEYIDFINENIGSIYKDIVGSGDLYIEYVPNIIIDSYEEDILKSNLLSIFSKNYRKELNYGMTLFGPHRDDMNFVLTKRDLKQYGSQGQQKLAVICYKLSEIFIFERVCGTKPVLLFDDIFSELDIEKRNKLLKFVSQDIQSVITTTDLKSIQKKYLKDAYIFEVKDGNVTRK